MATAKNSPTVWSISSLIVICLVSFPAYAKYSGGTGEPNDPYQIATASDLMLLGNSPEDYDKHFILTANIDLAPNLPGRKVFDKAVIAPNAGTFGWPFSGPPFTGVFDGNDHIVSNLTINTGSRLGLFGQLASGAEVKNVRVVGVNIVASQGDSGGLVGLTGGGTITNCSCDGVISGMYYMGGLVGYNGGASITRCYSSVVVSASKWSIGGLVGYSCGRIQRCYSTGSVGGASGVGGLVGENAYIVTECYSTGSVRGSASVGGLVGRDYSYSQAIQCFWDTQTSGWGWSAGGSGKTTAEMKTASTFLDAGWDFVDETANGTENTWWIDDGADYPRLSWEVPPPIAPISGEGVDPNLVGWWRFNEGYGTTAFDSSGNGRDGTVSGKVLWADGHHRGALEFDGSSGYVSIDGYKGVIGSHARTVTAWVRTASTATGAIVGWGPNVATQRMELRLNSSRLRCEHEGGNVQGATPLTDGGWHHVAVTVKEGATISYPDVRLYLDGVDDTIATTDSDIFDTVADGDVRIGSRPSSNDRFFTGRMDDVRIYDRALRTAEIRTVMANPGVVPQAAAPDPSNGAVIYKNWYPLRWAPGDRAVSHQVYIGQSFTDVNEGQMVPIFTVTPPLLVGVAEPFPSGLIPGATYYWRVDEVNEADPCSPWKGPVWVFSVDISATPIQVPKSEGFETMNSNEMSWPSFGDQKWAVTSAQAHSGAHSARAGSIADRQSSVMEITVDCIAGQISFYYKVSSESGFDCLKFYIDGQRQGKWSGEEDWTEVSFPVTEGPKTFRWEYSKDSSGSNGEDTAWIDDIVFPVN